MTQLQSGENLEEKHGFTMKINTSGDAASVVRMPQCCPFFSAFFIQNKYGPNALFAFS